MYNYGMSIASRYGDTKEEIEEIANDGFFKMLIKIHLYDEQIPFKLWLRKIIINCGIDHYRKKKKFKNETQNITIITNPEATWVNNVGSLKIDSEYLLDCIKKLSPVYKMVFVLYSIEGYSHREIASELNISEGTSKSNLHKARQNLQAMVKQHNLEN